VPLKNLFDRGQSSIIKSRVPALGFVSIHYHQTTRANKDRVKGYPAEFTHLTFKCLPIKNVSGSSQSEGYGSRPAVILR
jgi:hypothetical protein